MAVDTLVYTFILSLLPFGEARTGIPYAMFHDIHFMLAFAIGFFGNFLVYPLFMWLIKTFNQKLWSITAYKKRVLGFLRFAKRTAGPKINKYGFWGLMIFVMIPLPGTGAYMGTIAAALFNIRKEQAFIAISIGTLISCLITAVAFHLGSLGVASMN
jgi:uncharacterized membrane protein